MSIESVLYDHARTFAGLSALVGTRIYPNLQPQQVADKSVTFRRISSQRVSAMGADTGLVRARYEFDAWADNYDDARAIADQLRLCFQRWNTTTGTVVQDVYVLNDVELYEDDTQTHHVAVDFEFIYRE